MINCIALDDEPMALEVIKLHASKVSFLDLKEVFRDPTQALDYLQQHPVDLIFLDINMPDLSGIDFARIILQKYMVIFTTAYSEYAVESYELNALDYLLKPIDFKRFMVAANKVLEHKRLRTSPGTSLSIEPNTPEPDTTRENFVLIKSGTQLHKIRIDDILFVESDGNYVNFVLQGYIQKLLARLSMPEVLDLLPNDLFCRIHKSYIVAFAKISTIEKHQLKIEKEWLPIGKIYREMFLQEVHKRWNSDT
ncbi:hypothetical protein BKI52_09710 [marine bacterium AO1-C]|nr:hypothetical protein BKI52_09710 [marine bacterium AO1-C]